VEAVNARIAGTELAELGLDEIVRQSQGSLFDMAAQAWNHAFYWQCLHPRGGGDPAGPLGELAGRHFGDGKRLREEFDRVALAVFGSGWVWLVQHPNGALAIQSTRNAGHATDRAKHPAAGLQRMGTRVLHRLPERARALPGGVLEGGQLGLRGRAVARLRRVPTNGRQLPRR
jgi:superoxide dismutase